MKWLSQFETPGAGWKFGIKLCSCMLAFFSHLAFAFETTGDLRDSCRTQFAAARQSEAQLETLKNMPLRMVRIGGELDVALYDRLAQVRRQRIAAASVTVRAAQSALSGCLAKQLTVQQTHRMPAALPQPNSNQVNSTINEQVQIPLRASQPRAIPKPVLRSSCDPETEEYGCPVEPIRVGR